MEAFEKWWNNNGDTCHEVNGHFDRKDAEETWKAALEWVLKHRYYKQPLNGPYFSWHDKIKEELIDERI